VLTNRSQQSDDSIQNAWLRLRITVFAFQTRDRPKVICEFVILSM